MSEKVTIGKWGIILFFSVAAFLFIWQRTYWPKATLEVNGTEIQVLVARTMYQQHRGLGKRTTIAPYDGMVFPHLLYGRHGIVMRDMRFSIDIVWLRDGVVEDYVTHVPLEPGVSEYELRRYFPRKDVNMVLELPAGRVDELGIGIGTVIQSIP